MVWFILLLLPSLLGAQQVNEDRVDCRTVAECSQAINDMRREIRLELSYRTQALDLARANVDKRLESMNEFRAQLDRQAVTFVTTKDLSATLLLITNRLDAMDKARAWMMGAFAVLQFLFGMVFAMYLKKSPIRAQSRREDKNEIPVQSELI